MPLRDSLAKAYSGNNVLQSVCLSFCDQKYLILQTEMIEKINRKPSFLSEYQQGVLTEAEYQALQQKYSDMTDKTTKQKQSNLLSINRLLCSVVTPLGLKPRTFRTGI